MNKKIINSKNPVIVIFAPTASGKTALTRELFSPSSSHFILNAEIISADSQSVYKKMDIGTAKPDSQLCKEIPHHLINLVEPDVQFTVADFIENADKSCKKIYEKGKIPVVCGGTGFYIKNFLFGLPPTPESSETIRNQLQKRIQTEGNAALYAELSLIDFESAKKIHQNDSYRICRALEVFYTTGKTRSSYKIEQKLREQYDFLFIILEPPRDLLFKRISDRVNLMFEQGLEDEIIRLKNDGYNENSPGMKAIGYREWFLESDKEKIKSAIKHNSCKYAKKQFTYIRDINFGEKIIYKAEEKDILVVQSLIKDFIKKCNIEY